MDRFVWTNGLLEMNETLVIQQRGVRLYDGDEKAKLDVGVVLLSTHRLIWRDLKNHECCMAIPLSQIIFFEEQAAGIGKSAKIVIHLHPVSPNKEPGPYQVSKFSHIKLSFKEHGQIEFFRRLTEEMTQKRWERTPASQPIPTATGSQAGRTRAVGIVGIERKLEEKRKETDKNISGEACRTQGGCFLGPFFGERLLFATGIGALAHALQCLYRLVLKSFVTEYCKRSAE